MAGEREGGFRHNVEKGARYVASGVLVLASIASLGAGNLVVAGLEAFAGYVVWPKAPKPASA